MSCEERVGGRWIVAVKDDVKKGEVVGKGVRLMIRNIYCTEPPSRLLLCLCINTGHMIALKLPPRALTRLPEFLEYVLLKTLSRVNRLSHDTVNSANFDEVLHPHSNTSRKETPALEDAYGNRQRILHLVS
jgi:hypothetical protein